MSYLDVASGSVVSALPGEQKAAFIRRTYLHLAGAIAAFAGLEAFFLSLGWGQAALEMLAVAPWTWLIVLGAFMAAGYIAEKWASSTVSREMQYAGLGLYIVAQALIFLPLMTIATLYAPSALENAVVVTAALVTGLSAVVFTTRKDFSFLGPVLVIGGVVAFGVIICAILFGLTLGTFFAGAMILFSACAVLYSTSNVIHEYREEQHVAASLSLFASIAMMFYYVLYFFISLSED